MQKLEPVKIHGFRNLRRPAHRRSRLITFFSRAARPFASFTL